MVNTSTRPITVDGVRLDTLAWNIEKIERSTAQRRSGDYDVPNLDGVVASLNDALEPSDFGLQMWLRGTDADGAVTPQGQTTELRDNLDELLHLFGKRHALLDVRESVGGLTANLTNLYRNSQLRTTADPNASMITVVGPAGSMGATDAPVLGPALTAYKIVSDGTATIQIGSGTTNPNGIPVVAGQTYVYSIYVVTTVSRQITLRVRWNDAGGSSLALVDATPAMSVVGVYTRYTFTVTAPAGAVVAGHRVLWQSSVAGEILWATAGMWTTGPEVVAYYDGDTISTPDAQYAWDGPANTSTSTRTSRPYRRCWAKVLDAITPELNLPGSAGTFTVALSIPAGLWEDPDYQDWSQVTPVTSAEVATLNGATERINDAVYLVKGPCTTPRITDPSTGMWVELGAALGSGVFWRFNSQTWASRTGAALTLGSEDVTGTDVTGSTNYGGPSRAYGLPLVPVRASGGRRSLVTLTAASGIVAGTTALSVRARRKYAA